MNNYTSITKTTRTPNNMNTQSATVTVTAAVTQKKRGRKSMWETDYDAAVKRQWTMVMKELKKGVNRELKHVPVQCEVIALLTSKGDVIQRFGAVISGPTKVEAPKRGRKSLWETDPAAAAARELEKWLPKVQATKVAKKPKETEPVKGGKKRGRKSMWETDYDAAVKRQWSRVMKELPKAPKEGKLKPGVLEKHQAKNNESNALKKAKAEIMQLKAQLDALKM